MPGFRVWGLGFRVEGSGFEVRLIRVTAENQWGSAIVKNETEKSMANAMETRIIQGMTRMNIPLKLLDVDSYHQGNQKGLD